MHYNSPIHLIFGIQQFTMLQKNHLYNTGPKYLSLSLNIILHVSSFSTNFLIVLFRFLYTYILIIQFDTLKVFVLPFQGFAFMDVVIIVYKEFK